MLIVFQSKAASDVLMFVEHAQPILKAAGKDVVNGVPERGVFTPEQLSVAIRGIEAAVGEHAKHEPQSDEHDDEEKQHPISQLVGFRQRAYPLLAMLREAQKQGVSVTWEPSSPGF